jgi:hypothetical protein
MGKVLEVLTVGHFFTDLFDATGTTGAATGTTGAATGTTGATLGSGKGVVFILELFMIIGGSPWTLLTSFIICCCIEGLKRGATLILPEFTSRFQFAIALL